MQEKPMPKKVVYGVGFETQLSMPILAKERNKLITIMRHQGNYEAVFPFHLDGQHSIDFSQDEKFEDSLIQLVHRSYGKPYYYVEPLGDTPFLESVIPSGKIINHTQQQQETPEVEYHFQDLDLTNLKQITDREIDLFMEKSYNKIIHLFKALFNKVKSEFPKFDFIQNTVDNHKKIFKIYFNSRNATSLKVGYGNLFGGNTINLSYGNYISPSDNSANEIITHHIDDSKQLKLKMTMNIIGNRKVVSPEEIIKEIWKNHIEHTLKR